ncbi:MAG: FG-GAP-like repeat-containing protein [Phycisphaerales bacterium]
MRHNESSGMIKTVVAVAGLAVAMPAMAQFGGFGEILAQSTGRVSDMQDLKGADIDGDGREDLVFVDANARVSYYSGFADGIFDGPRIDLVERDDEGRAIELVDYDNDGDMDLLRVANINTGDFRAYKNDGTGDFEFDFAITGIGNVSARASLSMADWDGDGDDDAYVLVQDGIVIIENTGGDFSRDPLKFELANFAAVRLAAGDLDNDGRDDFVATSSSNNSVYIVRSDGTSLTEIDRFSPGTGINDIKLMDMDGDGDQDLIVANDGSPADRISVYRNNGGADYSFDYALTVTDPEEIEVLDIDGDGDVDITVEAQATTTTPERVVVYLNDGGGAFDRQAMEWGFSGGVSESYEFINIDPATGPDLVGVWGSTTNQVVTIRLNQTPFFEPTAPVLLTPANGANDLALPSQVAAWGGPVAPTVTWERADGFGITYTVVVSESPTLASPVFEASGITGRTADLSTADLQPGTTYFWTVFADNPQGSTEPTGWPFSFTTASGGVACRVDFDGDGSLTLFDFLAFSTAFDAGCP